MSATATETTISAQSAEQTTPQSVSKKSEFFEDVHFLGDAQGKIVIRSPPVFSNKLDKREYQKQHLAAAFRVFAKQGFDEGVAGHISLRDTINPGNSYFYFFDQYH
jgi:hypothetical protein